jgi:hypothetical protein
MGTACSQALKQNKVACHIAWISFAFEFKIAPALQLLQICLQKMSQQQF